ncbi:uncharacterized protein FOMMEDRAFT_101010 [Fomitiporia mediterranea MF3/22]|uniref:uncharacterized protein n=1 Tax=Fomitiporia mediterranea (strain MF3/22) TaxID=694068 RepID=UPI00044090C7|nr:uncharacterized protein FOMMEDRAFT_101010 [Fomitiporia mediterranea MF3/22]EJD07639.1 hypothetical protein FOMMEDRAFT_101010 [Fomitiporia mediterranea MF3/22]
MATDMRANMLEWDEHDVHLWLAKLGYPQYEPQIREHHITGDILSQLDAETLKEIGISTIGQRLAILKAVYQLKLSQGIEIEPGQYVPPSELEDTEEPLTLPRLHDMVKEQGERLRAVEDENRRLNENLNQCMEELLRISGQGRSGPSDDRSLRKQPSFKWAQFRSARSPTKQESSAGHSESPHPSPQKSEYDMSNGRTTQPSSYHTSYDRSAPSRQGTYGAVTSSPDTAGTLSSQTSRQLTARPDPPSNNPPTSISTSSDNLKSFKVSLEDPAWKVLPAALKKYKINNDDWQNYAMFICYGQTERCLSYDEKPLLLFQKLKDAKKNPVFMLKHIKDIRSPIAVAQQKHAARKASESSPNTRPSQSHARSMSRPSKLNTTTPPNATSNGQSSWPELMSPATEQKDKLDEFGADANKYRTGAGGASGSGTGSGGGNENDNAEALASANRQETISGISYAVAIYPYMAEQEDEFDVVVGDTFIILSRARGWWVVQRDPSGNGILDTDTSKQGWVPAGCLLETNVPVASAIAEANAVRASANGSPPSSPASKTPILPLSILSTSFPGIALMDYRKKGDEELDLVKDDLLRVFKRYNHWSYAVKEDGGDRGWVPSWFIGKVTSAGQVPSTPSTSVPANGSLSTQVALDSDFRYAGPDGNAPGNQVSPMSSAFPPPSQAHQRTAVV